MNISQSEANRRARTASAKARNKKSPPPKKSPPKKSPPKKSPPKNQSKAASEAAGSKVRDYPIRKEAQKLKKKIIKKMNEPLLRMIPSGRELLEEIRAESDRKMRKRNQEKKRKQSLPPRLTK